MRSYFRTRANIPKKNIIFEFVGAYTNTRKKIIKNTNSKNKNPKISIQYSILTCHFYNFNKADLDVTGNPTVKKAFIQSDGVCRLCHEECGFGCAGPTNRNCISEYTEHPEFQACKHVQHGDEYGKCLEECPKGYFEDQIVETDFHYKKCVECPMGCAECNDHTTANYAILTNPSFGYKSCCGKKCAPGYFRKDTGLEKMECLKICPEGYHGDADTRKCVESWTVIAFQDSPLLIDDFTEHTNSFNVDGGTVEPLTNFFNFDVLDLTHAQAGGVWRVSNFLLKIFFLRPKISVQTTCNSIIYTKNF